MAPASDARNTLFTKPMRSCILDDFDNCTQPIMPNDIPSGYNDIPSSSYQSPPKKMCPAFLEILQNILGTLPDQKSFEEGQREMEWEERGSTSRKTSRAKFDVFLSFRGPDTRANFTDSLYHALLDKGIHVFIDKGIDIGEEIGPEIFQAIDNSKICIPIFSKGYASSSWCLRELEYMMERRKTNELEVLPIFYDVEPYDVKLETRVYKDALTLHEAKFGAEIVHRWAEALKEVTRIKGWDTKNTGHGELTQLIARKVLVKLKVSPVHLPCHLVGIDQSVDEVIDLLSVKSKDIRLVGICGIGGIGKTTLTKVVYHKLSTHFESCSFIPDVRQASESSTGEKKRNATYMWDDCELFPDEGIEVLLLMSLIKIGVKNELWMHDQLKNLGRSIVRSENRHDPGKRSRVWNHEEALDMITSKKGTKTVEAICVNFDGILTPGEFMDVPNMRFLQMISGNLSGDYEDLFPKVRWLSWKNCPSNLQATNFCPKNLLILDLSRTDITESWNGWTQLEV
ncbi:disease resistance protein L6-like [Syzygium oleosum]|uniref:disease resistance protein L6-like n=1 Tax=Syzygium oleosum TaxID=219896 RepID=UPI0024B9211D|nr:disease resistance protein L6-like [Syzygium oleosum]